MAAKSGKGKKGTQRKLTAILGADVVWGTLESRTQRLDRRNLPYNFTANLIRGGIPWHRH